MHWDALKNKRCNVEIASPPSTHDHDYGESKYNCDDQDSIHWMCPVKMLEPDPTESLIFETFFLLSGLYFNFRKMKLTGKCGIDIHCPNFELL